ncbi:hypothetical protein HNV11_01170 [Spirosoma taeanense]|uniref:Sigma-70 family RNA polymerase sigma factor n=1 Tax=Spirosoma taeanense TaxID=2735870 RepID=A0A6M5Y4G0_9BACT|nr:hypothetical protein [Spirosoma taeanense]QJW88081.1 hypothetical protein HNV11_01170 [Spirosoma taeanense]
MGALRSIPARPDDSALQTDSISLYDRYSSIAYGVILQIIPQPEIAQQVLLDIFTTPFLKLVEGYPTTPTTTIIRMAREKALEAKSAMTPPAPAPFGLDSDTNDNLPKLVFDLAFRQGYTPDAIAERLQIPCSDVLKAIRTHLSSFRKR